MSTIFALSSAVGGQISIRSPDIGHGWVERFFPILWAAFLTLMVAAPWIRTGYLFGTDWPGPRRFDFPTGLSSSAPLGAALAGISRISSSEWAGKLLVLALLFTAALMAYRAVPTAGLIPGAIASTVYLSLIHI